MAGFDFNTPMMDMSGFGNGNPFDMGLLSMLAANNPGLISTVAANNGVTPPTAPSMVNGIDYGSSPLGAFLTPSAMGAGAGGAAGGTPGTPGAGATTNPWAQLAGFKGPQVPQPIMSGGVTGAQKAPEVSTTIGTGASTQLNQLIASLIGGMQPAGAAVRPVGNLGAYLGR
jgi:hypothetical protein